MILTEKRYWRFLLLAVGALLTGLTVVFPTVGFLEWISLIPVGVFLLSYAPDPTVRLRTLYGWGLFFFYGYYLVTFHWFVNLYPLDFIDGMTKGAAIAVVLVAWLGLSLFQALMGGLVFVGAGLLFRTGLSSRFPFLRPFLVAGLWAVYEWTQTLGWWGVPWGRLPLGQVKALVGLQIASWFGSYFITFLLVAVNGCLAYALCAWLSRETVAWHAALKKSCVAVAVMLVFQYGCGAVIWLTRKPSDTQEKLTVAVVQGNISSHEKWELETTERTREVYRQYTLQAAEEGAQIVVWPETALPYTVSEGNSTWRYASSLAKEARVTILVGAFTKGEEQEYNSIICFLPDGTTHETVYSKRRLVPFGEFVPMRKLFETVVPPLADLVMSQGEVAWGEGANVFALEEGNIGSLICFDSIYEDLTRESVLSGAELICLSTNDSWFTDSAALYMHNAQAQLRAIETGRYVARSANTGISTVISSRGEVLAELEPLVDGMLVEEVRLEQRTTLYTYIGNVSVYLCVLALAFLLCLDTVEKIRIKRVTKTRKALDISAKK
ncbi:MAG: apolipoprotein N-acyltransferase [Clostridia bacterium]|nr:apolipoprotein N-acyltransferase [Clostridia bacterium]